MLSLVLIALLVCWCWFGMGPPFMRWPAVVLLLLLLSNNSIGRFVAEHAEALAGPLLTLLIMLGGLMLIFRGVGWRPRPRYYRYGRWYDRHW